MKIDLMKVVSAIMLGIDVAERFRKSKTGPERLQIAKDTAAPIIGALEGIYGKDLLNQATVAPLVDEYVAIAIRLGKAIESSKGLLPPHSPVQ